MIRYPTLKQRYVSSLIDGVVILFIVLLGTIVYQGDDQRVLDARLVILVAIILSYEPILTSQLCTIGQLIVGIRVRDHSDTARKISVVRAYLRTVVKVLLGGYSFFAMGFSKERRAVHDFAIKSVVVEVAGVFTGEAATRPDI